MNDFTAGSLSRVVPSHTKTVQFNWIKRDFMLFGFYRDVREKCGMKIQTSCFWCRKPFTDDQMMAIAQPKTGRNTLMCHPCVDQVKP